jgi:hypothetical protein
LEVKGGCLVTDKVKLSTHVETPLRACAAGS